MKKLFLLLLVIMMLAPRAGAWEERSWVDEEGCLHIVGTPTVEGEREVADLTNKLNLAKAMLAAKQEDNNRLAMWLVETRNAHEVEMKEIEEQTSLNYLKSTLNLLKYAENDNGQSIYINNTK